MPGDERIDFENSLELDKTIEREGGLEQDERRQFGVFKNNPWPEEGYMIDDKHITDQRDCYGCLHHMFDGPFEVILYYDHDLNFELEPPVLALDVICGRALLFDISKPSDMRSVDIGGCRGASEGSEPVYVDAINSYQRQAMDAIVREARSEENMGQAGAGYQQASIIISAGANATKVRVTNSSSMVVVDRSIDGPGEVHRTLSDCVPGTGDILSQEDIPRLKG